MFDVRTEALVGGRDAPTPGRVFFVLTGRASLRPFFCPSCSSVAPLPQDPVWGEGCVGRTIAARHARLSPAPVRGAGAIVAWGPSSGGATALLYRSGEFASGGATMGRSDSPERLNHDYARKGGDRGGGRIDHAPRRRVCEGGDSLDARLAGAWTTSQSDCPRIFVRRGGALAFASRSTNSPAAIIEPKARFSCPPAHAASKASPTQTES